MKILLFGAGFRGEKYCEQVKNSDIIIQAFVDNNPELTGKQIADIPVILPCDIKKQQYDKIIITVGDDKIVSDIRMQLKQNGVKQDKIESLNDIYFNPYEEQKDPRVLWLKDFANYVYEHGIPGNAAECGVYRGEFAEYINKYFYDRHLYLFDTFDGFDSNDVAINIGLEDPHYAKSRFALDKDYFKGANAELVLRRMPHPQYCTIRQGYFPDTTEGIQDTFCFVNLDMDLYQPMIAGLRFFWDKMIIGGVLLLHDYFHPELKFGVQKAVSDFEVENQLHICKVPIGDFISIALVKH